MKKFHAVALCAAAVAVALVAASCASEPKSKPAPSPVAMKSQPAKIVIDHKNLMLGSDIPEWIVMDIGDIEAQAKYKDKYVFRGEAVGGSENGAKMLARQMDADTQIARMINLRVQNLFSGAQVGDDKNVENYMENVVKSLADAKVTGWREVANYWVQYEYAKDRRQEYRYFILFEIPKDTVKKLMADALEKAPAPDTPEKQLARDKVRQLMDSGLPALTGDQQEGTAAR